MLVLPRRSSANLQRDLLGWSPSRRIPTSATTTVTPTTATSAHANNDRCNIFHHRSSQKEHRINPMTQTVIIECSKGKKLKKNPIDGSSVMMSKHQKFPKGYSSSFIPDYRHAVETVGESDGFGSSGRADSEHSCTPKRRCISLNVDQNNGFNIPFQVFSTSKMSGPEKKEVEMRLRAELDKVQIFQKGIFSCTPAVGNGLTVSSSDDGRVMGQGLKRGVSGRFESTKQPLPLPPSGHSDAMVMKQCETILRTLMTHKYGWVFKSPVDVVALKIPDYFTIIKHPMDLGTVKKKLASRAYSNPLGFASDVRLTFTNAMTYNPPGNDVHIMADTLNKIFEKRWRPLGEKLAAAEVRREAEVPKPKSPEKKRKIPPVDHRDIVRKSVRPKITYSEKQNLRDRLEDCGLPDHIIDFLRKETNNNKTASEELEVDFDTLSDDALFQLKKLLDDCPNSKRLEAMAKAEPCEIEILVESGLSNSSPPCKENDPIEEEVDILGDDPPVSSYPPVEIEKDTALRNSKCSSSSSSSSDSDTSSSDSDSDSSSGSESDVHVATPTKSVKDNGQSGTTMEQGYPIDANKNINGLEHQEHHAQPKPASVESDAHHVGENATSKRQVSENATSKRQVSPDKNYRAALLKSRFADTILKAHEKTLNQNEKKDPEKLRREREELEKQQREEKARLQAEARAAEVARRQAKAEAAAEAAAEAKRKRELERERARQALLQMEKTVEINENNLFIKDLEMLRTAPGEDISNAVLSSDHLQEGMAGFKLGGSNPLEQLGLFMKEDDEEEDEDEDEVRPSSVQTNDVEEGEID